MNDHRLELLETALQNLFLAVVEISAAHPKLSHERPNIKLGLERADRALLLLRRKEYGP